MSVPDNSCTAWVQGKGGAWPWCDTCGIRADHHAGDVPIAAAVTRIVERVHVAVGDPITA